MFKSHDKQLPPPAFTNGMKVSHASFNDGHVHWIEKAKEAILTCSSDGILYLPVLGGSDNGEFAYIGELPHHQQRYTHLQKDDVILEIQGQKVAGYTQRDVVAWLNHCSRNGTPVTLKVVPADAITKDLHQFLNSRFQKGSVDHDLQNTIRDNLYLRTVPCTTRAPREGEINGIDYTFLTPEEFVSLERSGNLLESGVYEGNHYGTPKPPKETAFPLYHSDGHLSMTGFLPGVHPSSEGKRKRNRSNVEAMAAKTVDSEMPGENTTNDGISGPNLSTRILLPPIGMNGPHSPMIEGNGENSSSSRDLGPLPSNWEKAFTEKGEPYFIDHSTGTSHWLDPRLAQVQKKAIEDCEDDELPYGWEKIDDPHYGTYYIDHVNRRTQYENPVIQAKMVAHTDNLENSNSTNYSTIKKHNDTQVNKTLDNHQPTSIAKQPSSEPVLHNDAPPLPSQSGGNVAVFTRNPNELQGEFISTTLMKSSRGFGFTIVGGDEDPEEFLQIKSVVPNGPAWQDGKLKTGDVLVFVNDTCVLGYTHQDIVTLFQSFPPGETVELEVCRGYSLPFDPNDPNTEIVTTVAVSFSDRRPTSSTNPSAIGVNGGSVDDGLHSGHSAKSMPDLSGRSNPGDPPPISQRHHSADYLNDEDENGLPVGGSMANAPDILDFYPQVPPKPEFLTVHIVKGNMGFGFTIADSSYGQKVKKILDKQRCQDLVEGDILVEINNHKVKGMQHAEVVQVLKECPHGQEAAITVQRGSAPLASKVPKTSRVPRSPNEGYTSKKMQPSNIPSNFFSSHGSNTLMNHKMYRSKTPTADLFSSRDKEVIVPTRPKTPLVDTRGRPKTPVVLINSSRSKMLNNSDGGNQVMLNSDNSMPLKVQMEKEMQRDNVVVGDSKRPMSDGTEKESMQSKPGKIGMTLPLNKNYNEHESWRRNNNFVTDESSNWNAMRDGGYDQPRAIYNSEPSGHFLNNYSIQRNFPSHTSNCSDEMTAPEQFHHTLERGASDRHNLDHGYRDQYSREKDMRVPAEHMSNPANMDGMHRDLDRTFSGDQNHASVNNIDSEQFHNGPHYNYRSKTPTNDSTYSSNAAYSSHQYPHPPPNNHYHTPNTYGPGRYGASLDSPVYLSTGQSVDGPVSRDPNFYSYPRLPRSNSTPAYYPSSPSSATQSSPYNNENAWRKQSTSFEHEQPSPSSITRIIRDRKGFANNSFMMAQQRSSAVNLRQMESTEFMVTLHRQETGFGFRIVGGTEEGSQVSIGHIVPGGSADLDGRLRTGDEIIYVDGQIVVSTSHRHVVQLMGNAAANGHVTLGIRRKMPVQVLDSPYPYDVTVSRRENEGFGFVIISSVTRAGSAIGRIIENSPAERCGQLHVGDRILAVNGTNIMNLHHGEIVNLIKDSGYSVTLTIGPPQDDASSTASNSQRGEELVLDEEQYYAVELVRGTRGFGFSIRGGKEFQNMPLFVLRIADMGPAAQNGKLRIGDQIIEINGINTKNMTHAEAIEIIKQGGTSVRLLIKRGNKLLPTMDLGSSPATPTSTKAPMPAGLSSTPQMTASNSPVHQPSRLVSPGNESEHYYWDYDSQPS